MQKIYFVKYRQKMPTTLWSAFLFLYYSFFFIQYSLNIIQRLFFYFCYGIIIATKA